MIRDPIVEEIHQTRARLLKECGGDLDKLMGRYKALEERHRDKLVTLEEVRARRRASETGRSKKQ
ncbi:hypothetical protein JW916_05610 [Candidatus Sumerlaeota bacterium]|nr:hypothetical protein [Candidatus Sumerlaeota bacterium]